MLRPLQATPTIIEDNCFIGARSEIVEGVIVEEGSVIAMGVFIGQSTRIYDRASGEILQGRVPAGSVVVPGTLPSADGRYALACAVIVKRVDAQTRAKTSINELLRGAFTDRASRRSDADCEPATWRLANAGSRRFAKTTAASSLRVIARRKPARSAARMAGCGRRMGGIDFDTAPSRRRVPDRG